MTYGLTLITPPTEEPVTLADAKFHCKVESDDSTSDDYITGLISAARHYAEKYQNRAIMPQTWLLTLDGFPSEIKLPYPDLIGVNSIKYIAPAGDQITLDESAYLVDAYSVPARITPAYGQSFPVARWQNAAVEIQYQCGYADADGVPQPTKQAIMMMVLHWFDIRMPVVVGTIATNVSFSAHALLDMHKFYGGF